MEIASIVFIILIILGFKILYKKAPDCIVKPNTPNITFNEVTYPDEIYCHCGKKVIPQIGNIDTSTWDLYCECGKVAFYHHKREERIEQINNLLDS